MAWKTDGNDERVISEINITPLTDVMLVLLVIFMVTTPLLMIDSLKVKLPRAVTSGAETAPGVTVTITREGIISINGERTPAAGLEAALGEAIEGSGTKTVIIKADEGSRHGVVVRVLDLARSSGAEKLSIATERTD